MSYLIVAAVAVLLALAWLNRHNPFLWVAFVMALGLSLRLFVTQGIGWLQTVWSAVLGA
ncbi:hypothetical protein [Paraburkholderia phenazinium]|uniref:hypothetical protein n=1 Tax=Paraburkholderia phenazinium TaxID=60549 RepID=UPI00158ADC86|nr:hypothetical protein [Paraburkholderia phenazinium]